MNEKRKAYLKIHIAVFLFGFTAILGSIIDLSAISMVWWRVFFTSISIIFLVNLINNISKLSVRQILTLMGIGMLIGMHWITFYGSVKLSNASVCLICMSTASFFTALVEPILTKSKYNRLDLLMGIIIIPAMALIVSDLQAGYFWGVVSGLTSSLLAAMFSSLNKKHISTTDPFTITFLELSSAWLMISIILLIIFGLNLQSVSFWPTSLKDWGLILLLALVCTTFANVLTLQALKHLSAFDNNLVINLEPVYGIFLAILLLNEQQNLNSSFYIGAFLIIITVIGYPILKKRMDKSSALIR